MNVLIAPAHYYFSDKYGSEPLWAYKLVEQLSRYYPSLDVIVGIKDCADPLPSNVTVYTIFKSRGTNPFIELTKYILFYPLLIIKYIQLSKNKKYEIVHHMFPLSRVTFNPLIILLKIFLTKSKTIFGPMQLPQEHGTKLDLNIMLVGKSGFSLTSFIALYLFRFIIFVVKPFAAVMFRLADVVVFNSQTSLDYYKDKIKTKRSIVIPTGVEAIEKSIERKKINSNIKILCVGQLSKRKGQIYLLKAFQKLLDIHPNIELTLIGDGPEKKFYEQFVKSQKIDHKVRFTGFLPHSKIFEQYKKHDIFCLPSLGDPSPSVILEAMSYGLPIVAAKVGAIEEIVGAAGIVVKKENSEVLYKALKKMIVSKNLRTHMGKIGYARIRKHYAWNVIAKEWAELYKNL